MTKTGSFLSISSAAAVLTAGIISAAPAADARPPVDRAKNAVLRILGERASPLGFTDVVQRRFAVCGRVHVRNASGEDGVRPFVYPLVSEQAYILDLPAYPRDARSALAAIRLYCGPTTA